MFKIFKIGLNVKEKFGKNLKATRNFEGVQQIAKGVRSHHT